LDEGGEMEGNGNKEREPRRVQTYEGDAVQGFPR